MLIAVVSVSLVYMAVSDLASNLCRDVRKLLSSATLLTTIPHVQANLRDPAQAMRSATLNLLACFDQPPESSVSESAAAAENKRLLALSSGTPLFMDTPVCVLYLEQCIVDMSLLMGLQPVCELLVCELLVHWLLPIYECTVGLHVLRFNL